ncbi:MAG: rhomboid family intramembrane serine protease [Bacteroidales bacterium]
MNNFKNGFLNSIPPITRNLIIINLLVWLATITLPTVLYKNLGIQFDLLNVLGLHYFEAKDFNLIQMFTYMFLHDTSGFSHVFFNMFSVYMFGRTLEYTLGAKRFLIYYVATGMGAALIQQIVWYFIINNYISGIGFVPEMATFTNGLLTVGASGAVFGILLAFGMLYPNAPLFLMFVPIPIKAKYFVIFYGIIELSMGVANVTGIKGDNIAHFAHLGGMLFGFFLIKYWKRNNNNNNEPFIF